VKSILIRTICVCAGLAVVVMVLLHFKGGGNGEPGPSLDGVEKEEDGAHSRDTDRGESERRASLAFNDGLWSVASEKDPARRAELLKNWAQSIPLNLMEQVLRGTGSIPDAQFRYEVRAALINRCIAEDPRGTANAVANLAGLSQNAADGNNPWTDMAGLAAGRWADADVSQAAMWAQSLPDGPAKTAALAQMDSQLRKMVEDLAASDPQKGAAWVRGLLPGKAGERAAILYVTTRAETDPAAAATFATSLPAGSLQNEATATAISTWASTQPDQAAQWVSQLPEGPPREKAMGALITTWANAGAGGEAALQWLNSLPASPSRDAAASTFNSVMAPLNPQAAFQSAAAISDPDLRNQQLQEVTRIWLSREPDAARSEIMQSNLPDEVKSELLGTPQ